jgi:uncharacterized protein
MIFVNPEEHRLRAGWRISITTVLIISLLIVVSLFVDTHFGIMAALALIVMGVLVFSSAVLDKRPYSDYGFHISAGWAGHFFAGNVMAILAISFIVIVQIWFGWIKIDFLEPDLLSSSFITDLVKMFGLMLAVSIWEEAYFRGYLISNLKEGLQIGSIKREWAVLLAVVASAIVFGIAHANNPNANLFSVINISVAGIVLAYPYIKTGSMAISVGMHLSWNYFQGTVFGLPVSGVDMEETIITTTVTGPDLFTGGLFGPEGGLLGFAGLTVMAVFCYLYLVMFYKK